MIMGKKRPEQKLPERDMALLRLSSMTAMGRHFKYDELNDAWEVSTSPGALLEAHLKRVVTHLSSELGLGKLEDRDTPRNLYKKDRGDLIDTTTGEVIEIEHHWQNFIKHGHDPKKIGILVLGPDSPKVPKNERSKLPRKVIHLTEEHVRKWRAETKDKRREIAQQHKENHAIHSVHHLITKPFREALLESESDRQMPAEFYLEEELHELDEIGRNALTTYLTQHKSFLRKFCNNELTPEDVARFWSHIDQHLNPGLI